MNFHTGVNSLPDGPLRAKASPAKPVKVTVCASDAPNESVRITEVIDAKKPVSCLVVDDDKKVEEEEPITKKRARDILKDLSARSTKQAKLAEEVAEILNSEDDEAEQKEAEDNDEESAEYDPAEEDDASAESDDESDDVVDASDAPRRSSRLSKKKKKKSKKPTTHDDDEAQVIACLAFTLSRKCDGTVGWSSESKFAKPSDEVYEDDSPNVTTNGVFGQGYSYKVAENSMENNLRAFCTQAIDALLAKEDHQLIQSSSK